ncbi:MAG: hypothetical protein RL100_483 [Actinomycetota bacterium]|jgi:PhzF family phenazine biosynthesis protein
MNTQSRKFAQVDVFSEVPYLGNPVAVVIEGDGLTDEQMQKLASWTNLSETTFILKPTTAEADYRLRIFTPGGELPFAGHPTLGSAHAWLENGGQPKSKGLVVQECGAGLVTLMINEKSGSLSFQAPPTLKTGDLDAELLQEICEAFGLHVSAVIAHQWIDNGPGWVCVQLESAEKVLELNPKFVPGSQLMLGVVGAYPEGNSEAFELRAFAPKVGVYEDPVTGSLNASVAQWLKRSGAQTSDYRASQGVKLGRAGIIEIKYDDAGAVWVGGATTTLISGRITF